MLSADHLYTLNLLDVLDTHQREGADLTMVTTEVAEYPSRYAVVQARDGVVTGFDYKPDAPSGRLVAAEIFCYSTGPLLAALDALQRANGELGDYGEDLLPYFVAHHRVVEHRLDGYWMDMGTLQSYWTAHLQLVDGNGAVLDDPRWPIYSAQPQLLPARIERSASVADALVAAGATVRGSVTHSVIGPRAVIEEGATVTDSVVLDGARVGPGVGLVNCIVDIGAQVTGGSVRGSADVVTLIGPDGVIAAREKLDVDAALPQGFPR